MDIEAAVKGDLNKNKTPKYLEITQKDLKVYLKKEYKVTSLHYMDFQNNYHPVDLLSISLKT